MELPRRPGSHPDLDAVDRWPRAVARFGRGVRRYHDKVAFMSDRGLRRRLQHLGESLDSALADVTAAGQDELIRTGRDPVALHAVTRAGTLTAHATEAAMMAANASWHHADEDVDRCLYTVRTLIKAVCELVDGCHGDRGSAERFDADRP